MSGYQLFILPRAAKEIDALESKERSRLSLACRDLAADPRPPGCLKLTARDGWRWRLGKYRIIYAIDDAALRVTIMHVGHRKDIYR